MKRSAWMFVIVFALAACFLAGASAYTAAQSGELRYESELLAGNPAAAEGIELRQRAAQRLHGLFPVHGLSHRPAC